MPQDAMRWYTRGRGVGSAVKGIARAILTFTFTHEATARGTGRYTGSQPGHSLHRCVEERGGCAAVVVEIG